MAVIVPVTEMRDTTNFTKLCKESKEPVFVTKNGYGDIVCMSMELYEESIAKLEVQKRIYEGMNERKVKKVTKKSHKQVEREHMKKLLNKANKNALILDE